LHLYYRYGSGSIFCCSCWVGSAIFGLGLKNFPLKIPNFSIFFTSGKKISQWVRSTSFLLRVKSMLGSGPFCNLYHSIFCTHTLSLSFPCTTIVSPTLYPGSGQKMVPPGLKMVLCISFTSKLSGFPQLKFLIQYLV